MPDRSVAVIVFAASFPCVTVREPPFERAKSNAAGGGDCVVTVSMFDIREVLPRLS